jgi:hypothetical protein
MAQAADDPETLSKVKQLFASLSVGQTPSGTSQETQKGNPILAGQPAPGNMTPGELPATAQMEGALERELV